MVELFRRRVIQIRTEKGLIDEKLASNLLSWKHPGFSIDNSVRILDREAQESLAEYVARPPISLKKIRCEPFKGRVLFHTAYPEYFKENVHLFDALEFTRHGNARRSLLRIELTQHVPPIVGEGLRG